MAEPTLINSVRRALNLVDLLRTLVHERYLRREADGYVLGDRIMALGQPAGRNLVIAKVRPLLRALRDELRAAAYLSLYADGEIRVVDIADSPDAPRVDLWVGFHDAGHACALGKAVLGGLADAEHADYQSRHDLPDLTRHTITDRASLLREIGAGDPLAAPPPRSRLP